MRKSTRRLLLLLFSLPVVVLVFGVIYMLGMHYLEGDPRSLAQSLEWATETLTTTGYGSDNQWHHPAMSLFVIMTQFVGLFLVFLIFPVYLMPYFEERFESRLPRVIPDCCGAVLIYRFGPTVESLITELQRFGYKTVVIEEDDTIARSLYERGQQVAATRLDGGNIDFSTMTKARAIVANAEDHDNAVLITMARTQGYQGPIYAFSEDPLHRPAMMRAGATEAFTPRLVLANMLAGKASRNIRPHIAGAHRISEHVGICELRIHANSPLAEFTLGEARIRERIGATVIAQWIGGRFVAGGKRNTRIHTGAIIVAVGSHDALQRLAELACSAQASGPIVIAGYGEVGRHVRTQLLAAGEQVRVINNMAGADIDVVGNVMDSATLAAAGVRSASAVILTLGNDSETLFATAVIRGHAPQAPVFARVNLPKSVDMLYRLGADFVLSVSEVSGQMLARKLIGEEYVSVEPQLKIVKVKSAGFTGQHPWQAGIRERTDCHLVAVERAETVHVEFTDDFRIEAGDVLYVCGTPGELGGFFEQFPCTAPMEDSDI